jgi:glycosyltransferase involved in cell wall biosynthesis
VAETVPSFSVLIPARNAAATIARAVSAAAQQTVAPAEIVVVDDGSTDDTVARAQTAAEVTLVRIDGWGVAAARNEGARHTTGDWIAFLDADDWWAPDYLAAAGDAIRRVPDAVACLCAATPVNEEGTAVGAHAVGAEVTFEELITRRVTPTTSGTLVRRDAFQREDGFFTGFERAAGVEDLDLWLRLALSGRFAGQPRPLATYLVQDRRDARRTRDELVVERLAARGDVAPELLRAGRRALRTGTAHYWLRAGFRRDARRCALMSTRCGWTSEAAVTLLAAALPRSVTEVGRRALRRKRA